MREPKPTPKFDKFLTTTSVWRGSLAKLRRIASHDHEKVVRTLDAVLNEACERRNMAARLPIADTLAEGCEAVLPSETTFARELEKLQHRLEGYSKSRKTRRRRAPKGG